MSEWKLYHKEDQYLINHPDFLSDHWLEPCYQCAAAKEHVVWNRMPNGVIQFKAVCSRGHKTSAMPYFHNWEFVSKYLLSYGKYSGKTLRWVFENDYDYINWCLENLKDKKLLKIITEYIDFCRFTPPSERP